MNAEATVSINEPHDPLRPAARRYDPPGPGSWSLDAEHCERPHSRWISERFAALYTEGFRVGMARYGSLLDTIECRIVHGFAYMCPRPVGAPPSARGTPPRPIFWLLTRLHPAIRRRIRRAAEVMESRLWREDTRVFFEELWPRRIATYERIQAIRLEQLDDEGLVAHLEEMIELLREVVHEHFTYAVTAMLPVGDFLVHAMDWTGCDCKEALALLSGYSPYSVEVLAELDAVCEALRADPEAQRILESDGDGAAVLQQLRARSGATAAAVERWLDRVGQRVVTGHDVAELRGIEMPDVLIGSLRSHLSRPSAREERAGADEAANALRARVPAPERERFDELLAEARLVHPLRDAHSVLDFWGFGLIRRSLLEAGRRLRERGQLHAEDHVVDLGHAEIASLVRGGSGPGADEVAERVAVRAGVTSQDVPELLGRPPSPPPPPEWLPGPAARVARAVGLYVEKMFAAGPGTDAAGGEVVSGVGASAGVYTGTARLVLTAADFGKVREGDVLVARITTPSYNVLLPLLGAVVTDRGGLLSHPAIVSREYGIPGVVGAREATARIADGARVRVDGASGTVTVLE